MINNKLANSFPNSHSCVAMNAKSVRFNSNSEIDQLQQQNFHYLINNNKFNNNISSDYDYDQGQNQKDDFFGYVHRPRPQYFPSSINKDHIQASRFTESNCAILDCNGNNISAYQQNNALIFSNNHNEANNQPTNCRNPSNMNLDELFKEKLTSKLSFSSSNLNEERRNIPLNKKNSRNFKTFYLNQHQSQIPLFNKHISSENLNENDTFSNNSPNNSPNGNDSSANASNKANSNLNDYGKKNHCKFRILKL